MNPIFNILISAVISSGIAGALVGFIFTRRNETIAAEVRNQFEQNMTVFKSNYQWKEKVVSELLGQMVIQFNRTSRALRRYLDTNLFLEAKVLKESNEKIRDLLLEKAHLIPVELLEDASKLIEHYDVWLEEFNKHRNQENPNLDQTFIFVGPKGFGFPREAEAHFKQTYEELWNELYTA